MKFCPNCGNSLGEGVKFCNYCGTRVNQDTATVENNNSDFANGSNVSAEPAPKLTERNIVVAILLTIITCGIYGIYWYITMTDEINDVSDDKGPTGGMTFLYTIITCGIYYFIWAYKSGQRLYESGRKYNKPIADNSVIYLILSIFGLSIVTYCLIQSDLNKYANN